MPARQKRNSIVIPDDSSEESIPLAQVTQEEVTQEEVESPLSSPPTSPIPPPPPRLSPAIPVDIEATLQAREHLRSVARSWNKSLSDIASLESSTATQTGPDTYPSPVHTAASLANPPIKPPPTSGVNIPSGTTDAQTDMNRRSVEFQAEIAKLRIDKREAANNDGQLVHEKVADMNRGTEATNGALPIQVASPPAAPGSGIEGEANIQPANNGLNSVNHDPNGIQNEDSSPRKVETQHVGETVPKEQMLPKEETAPKERTITDAILEEVRASTRKPFMKGDAAVIMDTCDLTSTLLISYDHLSNAAPELCENALDTQNGAPLRLIVLLEQRTHLDHSDMPRLSTVKPSLTEIEFLKKYRKPQTRARAAAEEARLSGNVKKEDQENDDDEQSEDDPPTDWKKAYKTVFTIITGAPQGRISKMLSTGGAPLLPQIEGAVAIANQYNLLELEALNKAFSFLLLEFITHQTLWSAIATRPVSWLAIGLTMRNDMVYREALKHVCGIYPACAKVPDDIVKLVERKSKELRYLRLAVDQELLTLNLQPSPKSSKKRGVKLTTLDEEMTDYKQNSVASLTCALFRDYVCDQIRLLESNADEERTQCKYSLAGFYHTIRSGGDSYLAADKVVADWPRWEDKLPFHEGKIRELLKRLKSEASGIVACLTRSTLQYERKEELEYLTCVDVEDGDVPWKKDEDVDMEDD